MKDIKNKVDISEKLIEKLDNIDIFFILKNKWHCQEISREKALNLLNIKSLFNKNSYIALCNNFYLTEVENNLKNIFVYYIFQILNKKIK